MAIKILVVDDDELDRQIMERFLTKAGYKDIIMAETGEDGLAKAKSENPNLIILDLMLPKLDGYKICRMLKFDHRYQHIPIIMCSSRSQEKDRKTALEVGADMYFTKNFDPQELLEKINSLLSKKQSD